MYLLAKKLPHTLVSGENDEFKKLLAQTEAKDIVAFATAVGQQAKEIDGKVCKDKKKGTGDAAGEKANGLQGRWSCINPTEDGGHAADLTFSKRFGELTGHDKRVHDTAGAKTPTGWPGTGAKTNDTSDAMAEDIGKLQRPDKAKVAGLLSKTISGAEVAEIRAVSKFAKSSPNEKRSHLQKQQYNNF